MRINRVLATAAGLALALTTGAAASAAPAPSSSTVQEAVRFELPEPTGRYPVGSTELHLVDRDRPDPWVSGRDRELMVSVWYPARSTRGYPRQPYLRPGAARHLDESGSYNLARPGEVDWAAIRTDAASGAPADSRGRRPVLLYSPGLGMPRSLGTSMAMELASRGYVVVTMDHTYETSPVEFPDGRVELAKDAGTPGKTKKAIDTRVRDTRFVLDQLAALRDGRNPDAEGRPVPHGLGRALDLKRTGMYGHSGGGVTAAETMRVDPRIDAGINMDGTLQYSATEFLPVALEGLDRPFMLMGKADQTHLNKPSWQSFWDRSTGWKRDLSLERARHFSYTDAQSFVPALDETLDIPAQLREDYIGTVDPEGSVAAQRAYIPAFFDQHLRGRPQDLLDGPSPDHPEVRFIR
ncbi:alpha/beta hydrolase family protein [Streptomyces botrytidirepellens]|uniref:alpha/beta hydrolase family protein n=1 Tax=Streptomyces botrytidirepellens TaxID=2486417 RepID=UPI00160E79C0|nr:lipase [Streptomyces botrytidirepellens]